MSKDPYIQALLKEAEGYDNQAPGFGDKLTEITQKISEYQRSLQGNTLAVENSAIVDPADAFMCDSCQ